MKSLFKEPTQIPQQTQAPMAGPKYKKLIDKNPKRNHHDQNKKLHKFKVQSRPIGEAS